MNVDMTNIPLRSLLRESLFRLPRKARNKILRRQPTSELPDRTESFDQKPFATLELPGRPSIELWSVYRDHIKRNWRGNFWPIRTLLELDRRVQLPDNLHNMAKNISSSRTLSVELSEVIELLRPVALNYPQHIKEGAFAIDKIPVPVLLLYLQKRM